MTTSGKLSCPACSKTWRVIRGPEDRGYLRETLISAALEMARHMRDAHDDDKAALGLERWVLNSRNAPGQTKPPPTLS